MIDPKDFATFEDPNRCSYCREPISEGDQKNGLVFHVKRAPCKVLDPETGKVMGFQQPDGPANRYLHARPCGELYADKPLVCIKCNYWRMSPRGSGLCLCKCHPSNTTKVLSEDLKKGGMNKKIGWKGYQGNEPCGFWDNDMERAGA